ncbi:hypothetical protein GSY74_03600, partial [Sulfurovum sp. bin170]|uniref:hypothetical protein n=1 Tax=Sulfurovum sp. bin170 TaxID=2695268 RepID=UPI0013DE8BD4
MNIIWKILNYFGNGDFSPEQRRQSLPISNFVIYLLLLSVVAFANTQPYKKVILFEKLDRPSLVRVKLDNEIYKETTNYYPSVRLQSSQGLEGYFIKPHKSKLVATRKTLKATNYDRKNAKLTYHFEKPFEIEKIELNIEDRNFESLIDIYIDGKLLSQNCKIFDYSQETGNQNFSVTIPKQRAKEVTIVYHLDRTTSFYKKYRDIREFSKYLTIKSVTFSNHNRVKVKWNSTEIEIFSTETKEKKTSYIFKVEGIPTHSIEPNVVEQNFKRAGIIYSSKDLKEWSMLKKFSFSASTLVKQSNKNI